MGIAIVIALLINIEYRDLDFKEEEKKEEGRSFLVNMSENHYTYLKSG